MPRANIDLSALFGMLSDKPLAKNPEYYGKPGDVPFDYSGDPNDLVGRGNPYLRPSAWTSYFHPEALARYNKYEDIPLTAQMNESIAAQYFPSQLAREQLAQQATREAAAKFSDVRFPVELGHRGQELQQISDIAHTNAPRVTEDELARQAALGEQQFGMTIKHAPILAQTQEEINAKYGPLAAQREREYAKLAAQAGSDTNKALWKARVYDANPALQQLPFDTAYAQFGGSSQINYTDVNPNTQAASFAGQQGPQTVGLTQGELASQALRKAKLRGVLGTPTTEALGEDINANLGMQRSAVDLSLLPTDTRNRVAQQDVTRATLGNELFNQQNLVPGQQRVSQISLDETLRHPDVLANITRNTLYNKNFQEATNIDPSRLGEARSLFRPSETGMTIEPRAGFVPESIQNYRDTQQLIGELSGAKSKYAGIFPQKPVSNVIPITPSPVTPTQVRQGFPNGAPSTARTNTSAPAVTRPAAAADIMSENYRSAIKQYLNSPDRARRSDVLSNVLTSELGKYVKLPTEYIGSSNVQRDPAKVLLEGLRNPEVMAKIEEQLSKLTPEQQTDIYNQILAKIKAR